MSLTGCGELTTENITSIITSGEVFNTLVTINLAAQVMGPDRDSFHRLYRELRSHIGSQEFQSPRFRFRSA